MLYASVLAGYGDSSETSVTTNTLIVVSSLTIFYILYRAAVFAYETYVTSPMRYLPGPKSESFLWGNMKEIFNAVSPIALQCPSLLNMLTRLILTVGKMGSSRGVGQAIWTRRQIQVFLWSKHWLRVSSSSLPIIMPPY
jgi:hypothetical protein